MMSTTEAASMCTLCCAGSGSRYDALSCACFDGWHLAGSDQLYSHYPACDGAAYYQSRRRGSQTTRLHCADYKSPGQLMRHYSESLHKTFFTRFGEGTDTLPRF